DDVARLVHLFARVRVDEEREAALALGDDERAIALAASRARVDERVDVERGQRLANLATERTRFELVQLEELLRLAHWMRGAEPRAEASDARDEGGGDVEAATHAAGLAPHTRGVNSEARAGAKAC